MAQAELVCSATLGQRHEVARRSIRQLLTALPQLACACSNVNLREHCTAADHSPVAGNVEFLKLNDEELPWSANSLASRARRGMLLRLRQHAAVAVVLTKGAAGSLLCIG